MLRASFRIVAVLVAFALLPAHLLLPFRGEPATLTLHLRRDWGYGGAGEIQGNFTISISGPSDLTRVVFRLDDQVMGDLSEPPWQLRFHTSQYPSGPHALSAVGYFASGHELRSVETHVRFLSSEQAGRATVTIVAMLLGGIGVITLVAGGLTMLLSKGKPGRRRGRGYGLLGGAVCRKCGQPFGLHWWAPNMTWFGKLDCCPNCGRWSFVRQAPEEQLLAAQGAGHESLPVLQPGQPAGHRHEPDRELEDSRYVEL